MLRETEDDFEDYEYDEDDPGETAPCPHCGEIIYDDSERCPDCGRYLSREDRPASRPWYVILGVILCLGMVVYWIVNFF